MYNQEQLKFSILSKLGSFWYRTIEDDATYDVHRMTHIASLFDTDLRFGAIYLAALGLCRRAVRDIIVKFEDKHVDGNTLHVDQNLLVTSIYADDGKVLCRNCDFISSYGSITFKKDPRALFPQLRIHIRSAVKRERNILCYPLGIQDVYGDVSFIVDYYRNNLSPILFYRACALAIGLSVVKLDCTVKLIIPQELGCSYIMSTDDRYDAWYPHQQLTVGQQLTRGTIIGDNIFCMLMPDDLVDNVDYVYLSTVCPVLGIIVQNADAIIYDEDDLFRPMYIGLDSLIRKYHKYLLDAGAPGRPDGAASVLNALRHFRTVVAPGRCIIVFLPHDSTGQIQADRLLAMRKNAVNFIAKNSPIGSIILYGVEKLAL